MPRKPSAKKPYTFTVPVKPIPKGRPRMTRRGRVFTPARTLAAEAEINSSYKGPKYEGPVQVIISYGLTEQTINITPLVGRDPSKLRGDIDNYLKLTMDALNGMAWTDDKQVHILLGEKQ